MSQQDDNPLAIFLMGPTASGKTDLAIQLIQHLPCEIISVDSALIYRGMDIGTAKPSKEELDLAPHRLIDIVDPSESYDVARFYHDALREMRDITAAGKIPLLVGGTMMYFRILRDGIAALPSADEKVRLKISADAEQHGWPYVHQQLAEVDPESAARIKPTDSQRLQRALEVYRLTGRTMSQIWKEQGEKSQFEENKYELPKNDGHHGQDSVKEGFQTGKDNKADYTTRIEGGLPPIPFKIVNLAIAPVERAILHDRIALRFRNMVKEGFQQEVERFYRSETVTADMPSMRCVGYRQMWDYLDGKLNHEEMIERGIIATRQLAKRQLTWLRSWPNVHWLETGDASNIDKALKFIKNASH